MKNLFLVINKEKIYAYIVSIMTIVAIFFMSNTINSNIQDTETTVSNIVQNIQNTENNESVEASGEIGEAISTSTYSNIVEENATENKKVESNSINE